MKTISDSITAEYTSPDGEDYEITVTLGFGRIKNGEDLDGNRGQWVWDVMDEDWDIKPEPDNEMDKTITETIGEELSLKLAGKFEG